MFTNVGNIGDAPRVAQPEGRRATVPEPSGKAKRDADVVELGIAAPPPATYEVPGRKHDGGSGELPDSLKALLSIGSGGSDSGSAAGTVEEGARLIAEVLDRVAANREQDVARVRQAVEEWHELEAKGEAGAQELIRLLRDALSSPADVAINA